MSLACQRCARTIEYVGERPSFCPYCGMALAGSARGEFASTAVESDITVDFGRIDSTQAYSPSSTARALPTEIAGYRLIRMLGKGGMGSVHEAEESSTGRRVALKLIAPEFTASAPAIERFLQEGRLASSIAHPRCVFVLAADQADGWPFIVMELMPGHTLKDLVEGGGPLAQGQAVLKILDVIEGLEEAHKLGVIHRDVKPSNCFLDGDGRVKVGDFGLSKSLLESDANLTRTGSFLGTPHYASPEQIKGELIDGRSDVYSVAATLFYLLTGRPPHEASDATVALARIVSEEAPSIRSIRPDVFAGLDGVVLRGLERDRKRRYRDLEEFREALMPFVPGRVSIGRIGLRATAYALDFVITTAVVTTTVVAEGLFNPFGRTLLSDDRWGRWNVEWFTAVVVLAYFTAFEVLGSASLGKRLVRLKVVSVGRRAVAGWREVLTRLAIFFVIISLPRRIYTMGFGLGHATFEEATTIGLAVQILSVPLLFVAARSKNGYRGVHELASQTGVIALPMNFRRRRAIAKGEAVEHDLHVAHPEGLPATVGPFRVEGALAWEPGRRVLLAEDAGLGRPAWLVLLPKDTKGFVPGRRDVGRLARPRWLGGGEASGWCWDAFVAPSGRPLADVVADRGRFEWHEARSLLDDLAVELRDAVADGTLPERLALDRVWLKPDGRLFLLDASLDPLSISPIAEAEPGIAPAPKTGAAAEIVESNPEARALELLRRVAIVAVGGKPFVAEGRLVPVGAPVPDHAIAPLERLCRLRTPYARVVDFLADLEAGRDEAPETFRFQRFGHAAYTLVATTVKTWVLPALVVAYLVLVTYSGSKGGLVVVPEASFDEVFLFQFLLWCLLAMVFREGLGGLIFNLRFARADGRKATRLRLGWRESIRWLPILAFQGLSHILPNRGPVGWIAEYGAMAVALVLPVIYVAHGLIFKGRYLNDRIARTAMVPK